MRKVHIEYDLYMYNYAELSEEAKKKVKEWYLDDPCRVENLTDDFRERIGELFPNSDLDVEWSLNSCQGDGVNIFGRLKLEDVFERISEKFSEKEKKTFRYLFKTFQPEHRMPHNERYTFCIADRQEYTYSLWADMENELYKNIPMSLFKKFDELAGEYLASICKQLEMDGYSYLYEIEEEELIDMCEGNEWEFLEDGTFWG